MIKWPEVLLLSLSGGKGPVQGSRWSLKSPTKEAQPRTRWFSSSDSSKTLLRFLKEGVRDHSVPPLSHTSPPTLCFQQLHHWELFATVDYITARILLLVEEKRRRNKKKQHTHQKMEQTEDRDGGTEGRANKERRAHVRP